MKMRFALIVALAPLAGAAVAETTPDRWLFSEKKDTFDGKTTIFAVNPARYTEYSPQRRPMRADLTAALFVICFKGETRVYVSLDDQLIAGSGVRVSYKLDDKAPITNQNWSSSTDSTATGYWGGQRAIALAKAIGSSSTMVIRTSHSIFGQMEARFETSNGKSHLDKVGQACRWK